MPNAEHARQRIVTEELKSIRDSLETIEEAMRSQWFKVCPEPECGHADLATNLTAIGCMVCGTKLVHESLAFDPAEHVDCGETCMRVKCGRFDGPSAPPRPARPQRPTPHSATVA